MRTPFVYLVLTFIFVGCAGQQKSVPRPEAPGERETASYGPRTPCGLIGTLIERLEDCSHHEGTRRLGWKLVYRSGTFDVWQSPSGLLWGDVLDGEYTFEEASFACGKTREENGFLKEFFRVPSFEELKEAYNDQQLLKLSPEFSGWFWTSSASERSPKLFKKVGVDPRIDPTGKILPGVGLRSQATTVRCVSGQSRPLQK